MWRNHNTQGYTDSVMAMAPENAPSRIFYGWWVALALSIIVFLSAGIRFMTGDIFGRSVGSIFGLMFLSHQTGSSLGTWPGGFLFDVTGSYGAAFGVAGALLLIAAILSLSIDEKARPACRAVPIPSRPLPVAGGS